MEHVGGFKCCIDSAAFHLSRAEEPTYLFVFCVSSQALMATETNYSGEILTTLMTESVMSGSPAMVEEVLAWSNKALYQHQV